MASLSTASCFWRFTACNSWGSTRGDAWFLKSSISHRIHGAGIYANIWGILMVNVTIYSIHGSYGFLGLINDSWILTQTEIPGFFEVPSVIPCLPHLRGPTGPRPRSSAASSGLPARPGGMHGQDLRQSTRKKRWFVGWNLIGNHGSPVYHELICSIWIYRLKFIEIWGSLVVLLWFWLPKRFNLRSGGFRLAFQILEL